MVRTAILLSCAMLAACATTGKRRVVTVADAPALNTTQVRFDTPEAAAACDTRKMRKRALDDDPLNDVASVTVLREIAPGRRTETDVDVNCRDFFASRLGGWSAPRAVPSPALGPVVIATRSAAPAPIAETRTRPSEYTYRVRRGDTLFDIARSHCTGWKTVADANGLRDASRIKPGQVLRIPGGGC